MRRLMGERSDSASDISHLLMPPPRAVPPMLAKHNSLKDTKSLFERTESAASFRFEDHFTWLRQLGSGSFGDVYEVSYRSRPEARFAVKMSKRELKSRKERAEQLKEIETANKMPPHPNVVEYYRAWQEAQVFYVQMELCAGGTLRHLIAREGPALRAPSAEHRVWEVTLHINRGLAHIHAYNVIHCDLKPENILVSQDGAFKIGDLGLATCLNAWDEQEGDARYLSRDLLDSIPSDKADIFSFGIMLYEIVSGEVLPGHGERWDELRSGAVPPLETCTPVLSRLIVSCMSNTPSHRPDANAILMATGEGVAACAAVRAAARSAVVRPQEPPPQRQAQSPRWVARA